MLYSKYWTITSLCWFLALPGAFSQNTDLLLPQPKWEFGFRAGAGFSSLHLGSRSPDIFSYRAAGNGISEWTNAVKPQFYLGGYATRYFSKRWSVRSELSIIYTPDYKMQVAIGAFPRYKINRWLKLEAGLEVGSPKYQDTGFDTKFAIGTVLTHKNVEFNMRFAPSYQPAGPFNRNGAWFGSVQAGVSVKLASLGKLKPKK